MIGFFPEIYEDELLYSQLCRYYQRTGYTTYRSAIDDLFMRRTVHPVIEWVNEYTPDAMRHITRNSDFETVVREHTMFPAYTRFLPKKRRNDALHSLLICDGNYYNLIVNQNVKHKRYLRYCPACAQEDRNRLGETYWHREHQIVHVDICPKHKCYLENSAVPIGSKVTPGLYTAENEVPYDTETEQCLNEGLVKFTRYILDVFRAPVDMETDIPTGTFLRSMLAEKYLSGSGMKVYSTKLYEDYCEFFQDICDVMSLDAFRKIYNGYGLNHFQIYQIAYFQGIPVAELAKRSGVALSSAMEELYRFLGEKYSIPYVSVCEIGEAVISKYRNIGRISRKSGPKQREWAVLDEEYLPKVKEIVDRIYNADGKPGHVSITRVEREAGATPKQLQNLPKCRQYVLEHTETQNEYRARKVTWAVILFLQEGRYLSRNKLNHFLHFRRNDLRACLPMITDPVVKKTVDGLLEGDPASQR